jgi:hypothetical protein
LKGDGVMVRGGAVSAAVLGLAMVCGLLSATGRRPREVVARIPGAGRRRW